MRTVNFQRLYVYVAWSCPQQQVVVLAARCCWRLARRWTMAHLDYWQSQCVAGFPSARRRLMMAVLKLVLAESRACDQWLTRFCGCTVELSSWSRVELEEENVKLPGWHLRKRRRVGWLIVRHAEGNLLLSAILLKRFYIFHLHQIVLKIWYIAKRLWRRVRKITGLESNTFAFVFYRRTWGLKRIVYIFLWKEVDFVFCVRWIMARLVSA